MLQPIDYLRFQAAMNPDAIAIQGVERGLSFQALYRRVRCIAHKLRDAGVAPGDVVMTTLSSPVADWLVTLALLHEATISASRISSEPVDPALGVRWYIVDRAPAVLSSEQTIVLDKAWLEDLPSGDILPQRYQDGASICRLVMTSGTTGHAKAVPFSVDLLFARLANVPAYWASSKPELNLMSISSIGGFMSAFFALLQGNAFFHYKSAGDVIALIERFGIVNLSGSPVQLSELAKQVAMTGKSVPLELVRSAGGMLSEVLCDMLRKCFGARIMNVYGSTEAGGTTAIWADPHRPQQSVAGLRLPNAVLQIVDDTHQVLPAGAVGMVRVRSPNAVKGYFRNDTATQASFHDGWFYPGDTGMLDANGLLVLTGRVSEIINCGGVKLDPVTMDEFVRAYPGVADGATFGHMNAQGVQQVAAAVVVADGFDFKAFQRDLIVHFGRQTAPATLVSLKQIPRNAMGKVQRQILARELEQHEQASRAASASTMH